MHNLAMAMLARFTLQTTDGFTTRPIEGKRGFNVTMAFVLSSVLFLLAGSIQSSPVPAKFSFEVSLKLEVVIVHLGEDAVFNCKTNDASAAVTFQRIYTDYQSNHPPKPGKITQSGTAFTIHDITVRDGGKYQCIAERKDGKKITRDILMTFDPRKPEISIIPFAARRILTGSNLTYACEGTLGTLAWFKENKGSSIELPSPSLLGVSITSSFQKGGRMRKQVTISNADSSHIGMYECRLNYKGKTMQRSVQVDVKGPNPVKITAISSHDYWVDSDKDITLDCTATGFPPPVITWKKDNQTMKKCFTNEPCAKAERYIFTKDSSKMKIVKAKYPDDDAVFSCEAKNDFGSDARSFVVVVPTAPVLDKSYAKAYSWENTDHIPCVLAKGSPTPSFSWKFGICGEPDKAKNCFWLPIQNKYIKNEDTKSTLEVPTEMFGQYLVFRCTANNVAGSDEMIASLYPPSGK